MTSIANPNPTIAVVEAQLLRATQQLDRLDEERTALHEKMNRAFLELLDSGLDLQDIEHEPHDITLCIATNLQLVFRYRQLVLLEIDRHQTAQEAADCINENNDGRFVTTIQESRESALATITRARAHAIIGQRFGQEYFRNIELLHRVADEVQEFATRAFGG
jgi:hypothetical protein